MGKRIFTEEQIKYVKRNYDSLSVREIGEEIGISEPQVRYILKEKIGVSLRKVGKKSRAWSEEEIKILQNQELTDYEKAKKLPNRTDSAVRMQRRRLGFESKAVVFNRGFESGGYFHVRKDGNYKRRNRVIAEKKIGRELKPEEVVHHINGIKTDDRPENLYVCSRGEHTAIHYQTMEIINELLENEYIKFDEDEGKYKFCREL